MAHRPFLALVLASIVAAAAALGACGDDSSGDDGSGDDGGSDGPAGDGAPPPPMRAEFGLDTRPSNTTCKPPARPPSASPLAFQQVYGNLTLNTPMVMDHIPGDGSKWFVALRGGTIVSFPSASPMQTDVKTVANVATLSGIGIGGLGGEGGLLGMAFHPKFATNGRVYISWTGNDTGSCAAPLGNYGSCSMRSHVGFLTSSDGGTTFTKYDELFAFDQTDATNHKGGCARFGNDGFLYLTFGDGGQGDDPYTGDNVVHNGQSTHRFFSKMLRIDVDNPSGGKPYGIPAGNPFADGMAGSPEVFAYGFRNPFRFTIDSATGDVWQGDVGQNQYEEVDIVKAGGNYGWSCREATHDYFATDTARCPNGTAGLTDPLLEQEHVPNNTRAIIGGRVYRGKAIPSFVGGYVWGDEVQTKLFSMTIDASTLKPVFDEIPGAPTAQWVDFAQDVDGEVYAVALNDQIWKMIPGNNGEVGPDTFPDKLSKTGCVDPSNPKKPASGLVPYTVNAALWSDGAEKRRWMALPDGATITVQGDGDFDFPIGTVMMKEFSVGGKRIETRLLMRHDDGGWAGYTYEWADDESDATLLPASKVKTVGSQQWYYPSRSDCTRCHSDAADHTLGPELGQLNGDYTYTDTNRIANQLHTLEHIGMFAAPLGKPVDQIVAYPDPFGSAPVDQRARAYVHSNCSQCHRPMGNGGGDIDFRFGTAFADMKICNVDPQRGDLGIAGAKLLVPGAPEKSLVSVRPHELPGANRMPPLATSLVDMKGTSVVDDWIRGVTACP